MALSIKENFLEAITYGSPEYVPMNNEPLWHTISFVDVLKLENWTDRFGVIWEMGIENVVPFPKGNPLSDLEKQLENYKFPNPDDLVLRPDAIEQLNKLDRDNTLVVGSLIYFCFERAWALMGMENFLMAIFEFPDEIHFMLHEIAKFARGAFDRYIEIGVDAVSFSEDLGTQSSMLLSPKHFREFLLPQYKYAFENVIKAKKIINFHSCGHINEVAGDLADIGVTIINPVQSNANDLHKLKRDVMGKTALEGGVDSHTLITGTPAEVREEVIRIMEILKPGGGYICGPDQELPHMPEENMQMLWKTAKEYGRY